MFVTEHGCASSGGHRVCQRRAIRRVRAGLGGKLFCGRQVGRIEHGAEPDWGYIGVVQSFAGMFETHLTVRLRLGEGDERLARVAEQLGLKYAKILLDQGVAPEQPMLTYHGPGTLPGQLALARQQAGELRAGGFGVVRVKIEAAPWNEEVPQTGEEASALMPGCYFEHHVKLILAGDAEADVVRRTGALHAGHLSRNARRGLRGGRHERFLTQRCQLVGRPEARRRLEALLGALALAGHRVIEVEEEFVVHDDNPGLDRGWAGA